MLSGVRPFRSILESSEVRLTRRAKHLDYLDMAARRQRLPS